MGSTYTNPFVKALDEFEQRNGTRILDDLVRGTKQYNALQELLKKKSNANDLLAIMPDVNLALQDKGERPRVQGDLGRMILSAGNKENPNYDQAHHTKLINTFKKLDNANKIHEKTVQSEKNFNQILSKVKYTDDLNSTGVGDDETIRDALKTEITNLEDIGKYHLARGLNKDFLEKKNELTKVNQYIAQMDSLRKLDNRTPVHEKMIVDFGTAIEYYKEGLPNQGAAIIANMDKPKSNVPQHFVPSQAQFTTLKADTYADDQPKWQLTGNPEGTQYLEEWDPENKTWNRNEGTDSRAAKYIKSVSGSKNKGPTFSEKRHSDIVDKLRYHSKLQTDINRATDPSLGPNWRKRNKLETIIPWDDENVKIDDDIIGRYRDKVGENIIGSQSYAESGQATIDRIDKLTDNNDVAGLYDYYLGMNVDQSDRDARKDNFISQAQEGLNLPWSTGANKTAQLRWEDFQHDLEMWEDLNFYLLSKNTNKGDAPKKDNNAPKKDNNAPEKPDLEMLGELETQYKAAEAAGDVATMRLIEEKLKQFKSLQTIDILNIVQ